MTPWDSWDYDGINEMVLVDLTIGGRRSKALTHFDRNGFAYVLDRTNGTLISAEKFLAAANWATSIDLKTGRPVEDPTKRTKQGADTKGICPGSMGGKDQQPSSFSPRTGLFYFGTNNICMNYEGTEVKYIAGAPYVGANVLMFPGPGGNLGEFMAWDPATGKKVWGIKEPFPAWSGSVVTASDLVFYGTMDGWFKAVNAKTGAVVWKNKLASGHDRQSDHLHGAGQEAVRRHLLRHRRLVRPPGRGGPVAAGSVRRARSRRRRLRGRARQGDVGRWHAPRLRARVGHDSNRQSVRRGSCRGVRRVTEYGGDAVEGASRLRRPRQPAVLERSSRDSRTRSRR